MSRRVGVSFQVPVSPSLGSRLPAHAVSMGRVLLAGLDESALAAYLANATLKKLTRTTLVDEEGRFSFTGVERGLVNFVLRRRSDPEAPPIITPAIEL